MVAKYTGLNFWEVEELDLDVYLIHGAGIGNLILIRRRNQGGNTLRTVGE